MNRCISKRDYLVKDNSNVGYALYVQENIRKNDYARLNTGDIVKVIGIKENEINKKAIYFNIYNEDWCDSSAVENFSENIIDLIEVGDIVEVLDHDWLRVFNIDDEDILKSFIEDCEENNWKLQGIMTKEVYEQNCFKLDTN